MKKEHQLSTFLLLLVLHLLLVGTLSSSGHVRRRRASTIPSFTGDWEVLPDYPISTIEAQGGFVGDSFLITGGFYPDSSTATRQGWMLDTTSNTWGRIADYPIIEGVTHGAFAIHDTKLYFCGGYVGGNPGPATDKCYVYTSTTDAWTALADLPEPRGAGGLVYSATDNTLIYSSGATRVAVGAQDSQDYVDTWMLDLGDSTPTWTTKANGLLLANHVSSVTGTDGSGMEHYYFLGGQVSENEESGNKDQVTEYVVTGNTWENRQTMTLKRGHSNAAAIPYGDGIIIAGGSINGEALPFLSGFFRNLGRAFSAFFSAVVDFFSNPFDFTKDGNFPNLFAPVVGRETTADVSFYDIASNQWTKIGELETKVKTPVCDIKNNWLYCGTGGTDKVYRRSLSL